MSVASISLSKCFSSIQLLYCPWTFRLWVYKDPIIRQIRWDGPLYLSVKQDPLCNPQHLICQNNLKPNTPHTIPLGSNRTEIKGSSILKWLLLLLLSTDPTKPHATFSFTAERFSSFLSPGVRSSLTEKEWKSHFYPCASDPQPKLTLPSAVGISLRQLGQTNVTLLEIPLSVREGSGRRRGWRRSEETERGSQRVDLCFLVMSLLIFSQATSPSVTAERLLNQFLRSSVYDHIWHPVIPASLLL